jgi:hypothetical protein
VRCEPVRKAPSDSQLARGAFWLTIHGLNFEVGDSDLRQAVFATAANFNRAETAEEQVAQRAVVGTIVAEVLRRNEWLNAKVKDIKSRERYD